MIKNFNSTGSFSYPVGDFDEYTPFTVTINVTTAFGGSDYIEVNLLDAPHPNIDPGKEHITRYWEVSGANFSSLDYDVTFQYQDAGNCTDGCRDEKCPIRHLCVERCRIRRGQEATNQ